MANNFSDAIFLNGVSLYGTPDSSDTTVTDTIIENGSSETKIGSKSGETILLTGSGVINFYVGDSSSSTRKAKITNSGNMTIIDEPSDSSVGYVIATNDSGTVSNHNILVYSPTEKKLCAGSASSYVPQTIVRSSGPLQTTNGIYMQNGAYIFGLGNSDYNSTINVFDSDVQMTHLIGMNSSGDIYVNYQKHGSADSSARTGANILALYGKEVRFYAGSKVMLQCTSTEVNVGSSDVNFMLQSNTYTAATLSFSIDSTNASDSYGSIKVIKPLRMCVCTIIITMKTTYSANTNYKVATIASSDTYSPGTLTALNAVGYNGGGNAVAKATGWITNTGDIYFKQRVAGSSGHTVAISGCWFYEKVTEDPDDI